MEPEPLIPPRGRGRRRTDACARDHPWTEATTITGTTKVNGKVYPRRACRICVNLTRRRRQKGISA